MKKIISWLDNHLFKVIFPLFAAAIGLAFMDDQTLAIYAFFVAVSLTVLGLILGIFIRRYSTKKTRLIKKGRHYTRRKFLPYMFKTGSVFTIARKYMFTPSCMYKFNDVDDLDKNKVFGIGFNLLPRIRRKSFMSGKSGVVVWFELLGYIVIKPNHWNSVMFAWNCDNDNNNVFIYPYAHVKGEMKFFAAFGSYNLDIYHSMTFQVDKQKGLVYYCMSGKCAGLVESDQVVIKMPSARILFMKLDLYFGGNKRAPHDIYIREIKE